MKINSLNFKKGFSLFEMTIVVVIMGIMASALLPLLDTKKIKMRAAERFSNEIYAIQDANRNYYMNEMDSTNGEHRFGFLYPPAVTDGNLMDPAKPYVATPPVNPFYVTNIKETISPDGLMYQISFDSPVQMTGVYRSLLPQSTSVNVDVDTDTVSTSIPIPGAEASRNNLLHRDSAVHQELRTMHGPILLNDNIDNSRSKLMITNINLDPSTVINTNGNINYGDGGYQTTLGDIGVGRYGIKGVGIANDLNFEAANTDSSGYTRQGYIQLGIFESLGSQAGANGKIRTLTNENNFLVSSYQNAAAPQWVTVIGDSPDGLNAGQLWTDPSNQTTVTAKINSKDGQVGSIDSFAVLKDNATWTGATSWNTAHTKLSKANSSIIIGKESAGRGSIDISDDAGSTTHITKENNFNAPSEVGQIFHVNLYASGSTIAGWTNVGKSCAGTGKIRAIIFGTDGSVTNRNTAPTVTLNVGALTITDNSITGFNSYIDTSGIIHCQMKDNNSWHENVSCVVTAGYICSDN